MKKANAAAGDHAARGFTILLAALTLAALLRATIGPVATDGGTTLTLALPRAEVLSLRLSAIASPSQGLEKGNAKVPVFLPGVPEPLPAPIAAPAPSTDQWTTIGKAGKAVKPTGKAAAVPAQPAKPPVRTTRHSIQKGDISVAELAETALERLDLGVAEKSFVARSDYPGIQFVKRLRMLGDKAKQKAKK